MEIRTVLNKLVIEPIEKEDRLPSGVYVPEVAKEVVIKGKVIAGGPGDIQNGELVERRIDVGEVVLFAKFNGFEIEVDGKKLFVVRENDVLAIL